ncbi:hypothetical protein DPMN_167117 [Dreissena polymorpha]|uniref:Uncharacterized protein n=1 Tax=Dreissena polymorpha TaxID=45954 RepID=A0A9D4F2N7_DREPO|nr:hypothetical protein DPMN_167117 [Dreissena polymorpha]
MTSIVLSCICLQNHLRLRNGNRHVSIADQEDNNHIIIPEQWRNDNPLIDGVSELSSNTTTKAANSQFLWAVLMLVGLLVSVGDLDMDFSSFLFLVASVPHRQRMPLLPVFWKLEGPLRQYVSL